MEKILIFLKKYKFLLIALVFVIITIVILVLSAKRGDELLNEIKDSGENKNIDIYKEENKEEMVKICLCYIDKENNKISEEYREIKLLDYIVNPENVIIQEYMKGSKDEKLLSAIPKGTVINKIDVLNEIATIDFKTICGEEDSIKDIDNNLKIESIVKTMKQLKSINKVKFSVDGETKETFCTITGFDKEY